MIARLVSAVKSVVHGVELEFSHVVYFLLIERAIHHLAAEMDWARLGQWTLEAVAALIVLPR